MGTIFQDQLNHCKWIPINTFYKAKRELDINNSFRCGTITITPAHSCLSITYAYDGELQTAKSLSITKHAMRELESPTGQRVQGRGSRNIVNSFRILAPFPSPEYQPTMISAEFAGTIIQAAFPEQVATPLAQIIMLDAAHGDSNIIDICTKNPTKNGTYEPDSYSWERYLIDTGPDHEMIRRGPPGKEHPNLLMVQFTHTDEDHSGGGQKLLEALATEETLQRHFERTVFAFHYLPNRNLRWFLCLNEIREEPESEGGYDPSLSIPSRNHSKYYPYMVTCMSLDFFGEHQKALEDGRYNIYLLYTFAINQDPVTKQCVPAGEKKRANQRYHQIEEGLDKVYREEVKLGRAWERPFIHRMILSPKRGDWYQAPNSLGTVDIIGPTKTIYEEFIGDSMRME
ncbi:uncharacterized protein H6S33_007161 [Morchella sextelata]|uniref:uncharacterized protein n=1 Tax=Morchella sextelata TaxID=1174677 RepID=UPI001D0488F6|nr:uncharacterized protein H6S33_007161 [Morchella sextelata]KAH0604130.1 hypothetical protein H6S33_007161 [Morchella sextelata]